MRRTILHTLLPAWIAAIVLAAIAEPLRADFRHARMGPRPRAMGSAFVGVADDANAIYWNPAGMTLVDRFEITGCRTSLFGVAELSNDYAAAVYNTGPWLAVGISWVRLELEDIYHEDTVNLGIARSIPRFENLSIGAALKIFTLAAPGYERYNDPAFEGSVNKASLDLGALYRSPSGVWSVGAVVYNVNEPKLQLLRTTGAPDPVYRDFAIGAGYTFSDLLLLSFDLRTRYGRFDDLIGRIGSEIWFFDAVALRGGFEKENLTAGFGLKGNRWQVDLMLETHYDLGNTYQFGLTIRL
ncbi:MAG: hypothetical protein PHQ19_04550 [Candidatus Krumholzibacteria bacterium]|nr:hypothetical protein [Candidatus Krumholzibacteria bacterium]